MKRKYFIFNIVLLFSIASAYGQEQSNIDTTLVNQCRTIIEYSERITQLNVYIRNAEQKVAELCKKWEKTCNDFLASKEQSLEDFEYLINNTDSIMEYDLYVKLVDARNKFKNKNEQKNLSPDNDKGSNGKKDGDKKDNDTVGDDGKEFRVSDDMNDLKSTIINKDKK